MHKLQRMSIYKEVLIMSNIPDESVTSFVVRIAKDVCDPMRVLYEHRVRSENVARFIFIVSSF